MWRYLHGPELSLSRFEIEGTRRAHTRELMAALAPFEGRNLLLLNLLPVASSVEKVPWVARVTVTKQFPNALRVAVREKIPVALLRRESALFWLGADGDVIAPFEPREEAGDFPLVEAPPDRLVDAARLLIDLQSELPAYASSLSEVRAIPSGGFSLTDSTLRVPVRVASGNAARQIRGLLAMAAEIESRGLAPRSIDLRFDRRIVLSGAFDDGRSI
jgi:cell division protein FtsQ